MADRANKKESLDVIVYTGGTFDLFHRGHVRLLAKCRELAGMDGLVVVSLNTDEFIKEFKNKAPVCDYDERYEVVSACKYVNRVIPNFGGADSKPAILSVNPDAIAIGSDWAPPRDYHAQMGFTPEWLAEHDIRLIFVDYTDGISSTDIRNRLA